LEIASLIPETAIMKKIKGGLEALAGEVPPLPAKASMPLS
jgi:hypothetical protein